jgi:hypothetical protein
MKHSLFSASLFGYYSPRTLDGKKTEVYTISREVCSFIQGKVSHGLRAEVSSGVSNVIHRLIRSAARDTSACSIIQSFIQNKQ